MGATSPDRKVFALSSWKEIESRILETDFLPNPDISPTSPDSQNCFNFGIESIPY